MIVPSIFTAAAANATSRLLSGSSGQRSRLRLQVFGTWTGTLKVFGRPIGKGHAAGLGNAVADFPAGELGITNLATGAFIAGTTGITASGVYDVDISGLEVIVDFVFGTGAVTVDAQVVLE